MKKVLITGATGFIGRQAVPLLLAEQYDVHAAAIDAPEHSVEGITWHRVDLLDADQVNTLMAEVRPSHLLHYSWYAVPGKYWTSPENLRWVQGSLALLQAFAANGGQRAVMAGTCAEYDWRYGYCSESVTPLAPATLYGTCKHAVQMTLRAFAEQTGLSTAWGRIFFLYGPGEHPSRLVASVIRSLLQGQPAPCSHGAQVRDFLHVRDVAGAFVQLLGAGVTGAVNVASGQPVSLRDIIYRVADQFGRRDLIRMGAIPTPLDEPPLIVADTRRLREEVGWRPLYDLDEGLAQTIEWWKNQN